MMETLQEKYDNVITKQYLTKMNHNLFDPFICRQKYCIPRLRQAMRSSRPHHKQRRSKKQGSKSKYMARKDKVEIDASI